MAHVPKFLPAGDRAITIELGDAVDEKTNALVVALDSALAALNIPGIVEMVPTYRSLLVMFDPAVISRQALRERVLSCWPPDAGQVSRYRRWTIPVLYGGEAGQDLEFVAQIHGISPDEVIRLHTSAEYRIYMIGFAPGFAYLGGLPEALHTSRRVDPRQRIPAGSIAIGGKQAAVFPPIELPSGWQLLGRTPVKTYDPARPEPFLLAAGDRVVFEPISPEAFMSLSAMADGGESVARMEAING
jgi:KipI family sensor histidine kinase inhibitor